MWPPCRAYSVNLCNFSVKMIVSVAVVWVVIATLVASGPSVYASGLVDSSTVRVNYYKNLYLSGSQRLIECNGLAMLAHLETPDSSTASCNDSDSDLLRTNDCPGRNSGAQARPLVRSQTNGDGSKSRNLSLENEFSIRVENVTLVKPPAPQQPKKVKEGEEGKTHNHHRDSFWS